LYGVEEEKRKSINKFGKHQLVNKADNSKRGRKKRSQGGEEADNLKCGEAKGFLNFLEVKIPR
jgi:hypothetical protein